MSRALRKQTFDQFQTEWRRVANKVRIVVARIHASAVRERIAELIDRVFTDASGIQDQEHCCREDRPSPHRVLLSRKNGHARASKWQSACYQVTRETLRKADMDSTPQFAESSHQTERKPCIVFFPCERCAT